MSVNKFESSPNDHAQNGPAEIQPKEIRVQTKLLRGPSLRTLFLETFDDHHPFIDAVIVDCVRIPSMYYLERLSSSGDGIQLRLAASQDISSGITLESFPVVFVLEEEELTFEFSKHLAIHHLVV